MDSTLPLIIPAFIAGLLTFLAPCTLPLLPGFLGFIAGTIPGQKIDERDRNIIRKNVIVNSLLYILGFTFVFVILGTLFAFAGRALVSFHILLTKIGALFIIFFGLYLIGLFRHPFFSFLQRDTRFHLARFLTPGKPVSSFILGSSFAFGWTPCVGPILGTLLVLSSTRENVIEGTLLLLVFSIGLGLPFLLSALAFGHITTLIKKINTILPIVSFLGGLLLLCIGILLFTSRLGLWTTIVFDLLRPFGYSTLINHL